MKLRSLFARLNLGSGTTHHVLGMNRRNIAYVYAKNPRQHFPLADDKLRTKSALAAVGIPVAETLCTFSSYFDLSHLAEKLNNHEEFVIKPARGRAGRGILVIVQTQGSRYLTAGGRWLDFRQLRRHVSDIVFGVYAYDQPDTAIVERRVHPHPFFKELWEGGLSDLRVIVVDNTPIMCMIRVPTQESEGKANLHQGALGLGVDISTGRIQRAWYRKKEISRHPDTGVVLLGRQVPNFENILEIANSVSKALPLDYLGIDVVVDQNAGPLILEINVRPGLEIQNVCNQGLAKLLVQSERGM